MDLNKQVLLFGEYAAFGANYIITGRPEASRSANCAKIALTNKRLAIFFEETEKDLKKLK